MAIWQYSFQIVPVSAKNIDLSGITMLADFDADEIWQEARKPCSDVAYLENILPKGKTWHESLTVFGNLESNEVSVWCKGGIITSFSMRIDFQTGYVSLAERLLNFFKSQGLCLLDQNVRFVELDLEAIIDIIENCPQRRQYNELRNER